jgi:hypothetical protein
MVSRAIPQYLFASRNGFGDAGHLKAINEGIARLRNAVRRVELYCKSTGGEFDKWKRLTDQTFPAKH